MAQDAELGAAAGYLKQASLHLHGWRNPGPGRAQYFVIAFGGSA